MSFFKHNQNGITAEQMALIFLLCFGESFCRGHGRVACTSHELVTVLRFDVEIYVDNPGSSDACSMTHSTWS